MTVAVAGFGLEDENNLSELATALREYDSERGS
jgi:hypothetical protein